MSINIQQPVTNFEGVTQFLQQVIAEMAEAGFKLEEEPTTLLDQYLLIFKKVLI